MSLVAAERASDALGPGLQDARRGVSPDALVRLLPRLFTASHLQQLAWHGVSDLIPYAMDLINQARPPAPQATVANLLDEAFGIMRRTYPAEYVFKACLLKRLLFGRHSPRTTSCYFELPVGTARADMVLVNGEADVYEVKSRFDGPARLETQLREYYRCFKRVTVVTEAGEAAEYLDRLPDHVGVAALTPRFSISIKRSAAPWHDGLEHSSLFRMLHQAERYRIAEADLGLSVSKIDPAVRYPRIFERFASFLSVQKAHARVVGALRARQRTKSFTNRCSRLPESLHVAAFSYRLRRSDWTALFSVLTSAPRNA